MPLLLEVENLKKHYPIRKGLLGGMAGKVYSVDGVSFTVAAGETLGLVGESGCGKSTVARTVMRLVEPTSGSIRMNGVELATLGKHALRPYRRQMQMIFQDPFSSLNPRMLAGDIVAEPMLIHRIGNKKERQDRVSELFSRVGLRPAQMGNFPHQFSGGQRQRIGIARALASDPQLIIGDEPVSALDVSIQGQVINLLMDLQEEKNLSYLFIAHDLAVVKHISHRIAVMYLGRIVELAGSKELFRHPLHPYTQALMDAVPRPKPGLKRRTAVLPGEIPSPMNPPQGCHFNTRCGHVMDRCRVESPALQDVGGGHLVACHLHVPTESPITLIRGASTVAA